MFELRRFKLAVKIDWLVKLNSYPERKEFIEENSVLKAYLKMVKDPC